MLCSRLKWPDTDAYEDSDPDPNQALDKDFENRCMWSIGDADTDADADKDGDLD